MLLITHSDRARRNGLVAKLQLPGYLVINADVISVCFVSVDDVFTLDHDSFFFYKYTR